MSAAPLDGTSPHSKLGPSVVKVQSTGGTVRTEHRPIQNQGRVAFPTLRPLRLAVWGTGAVDEAWKTHDRCRFGRGRGGPAGPRVDSHHQTTTPGDTKVDPFVINGTALTGLSTLCPRRRSSSNQVAVGKGWVTPSTTLADGRSGPFAISPWPGFRIVHYSIQNDHAHFLVEADDKLCLANGMKSLGARFARCVNRVCQRAGGLATRFHHVLKRTPTEVRNALAYVVLNARKHYRQRRGRKAPVRQTKGARGEGGTAGRDAGLLSSCRGQVRVGPQQI